MRIVPMAGVTGKPELTNPMGAIQGGLLAAMLDDTLVPADAGDAHGGALAMLLALALLRRRRS